MKKKALVVIDYINEIVDPKGKLAGKGYVTFVERHSTLKRLAELILHFRSNELPVIYVRVGFTPNYDRHPEHSPLFGAAKKFGALQSGTWATEFHPQIAPMPDDVIVAKSRVSAFFGTRLNTVLRDHGIAEVVLAGVATDLAVQSAARDAHDLDYSVTVIADCCAAATDEDHESSLKTLRKIARVADLSEFTIN